MDAKLTLKLEKEVIQQAKQYARQQNYSLSRLVENLLRGIITQEGKGPVQAVTSRVRRLSGVLESMPDLNEEEIITNYLMEKHR